MLDRIIRALTESTDSEALTRLAVLVSETLNRVVTDDALFIFNRIAFTFSQSDFASQGAMALQTPLQVLNLATAQSYIPASILLGFVPFCDEENQELFRQAVAEINWITRNSIYRNFPRPVTKELEQLSSE